VALIRTPITAELPLPDELHPDAATHRRIGRFARLAFRDGAPFD
jgi:hypothetical protein